MDDELLERLLWRSEGDSLDFKRDQFPFSGADERTKSELVKDILALANSWRTEDGYILFGVEERKGQRGLVHGVTDHLEDAAVQQLVNLKTNRPVRFAYIATQIDGLPIGVIKVDVQERPTYLKKTFGKVEANTVYLRRGSSTAIATLDEVAAMGKAAAGAGRPSVELELANTDGVALGDQAVVLSKLLKPLAGSQRTPAGPDPRVYQPGSTPRDWRDYRKERALVQGFRLLLRNVGGTVANNLKVQLVFPNQDGLVVYDWWSLPVSPQAKLARSLSMSVPPSVDVEMKSTTCGIELVHHVPKLRPKESCLSTNCFYLGAGTAMRLEVDATIFGDDLSQPRVIPLRFDITPKPSFLEVDELEQVVPRADER